MMQNQAKSGRFSFYWAELLQSKIRGNFINENYGGNVMRQTYQKSLKLIEDQSNFFERFYTKLGEIVKMQN